MSKPPRRHVTQSDVDRTTHTNTQTYRQTFNMLRMPPKSIRHYPYCMIATEWFGCAWRPLSNFAPNPVGFVGPDRTFANRYYSHFRVAFKLLVYMFYYTYIIWLYPFQSALHRVGYLWHDSNFRESIHQIRGILFAFPAELFVTNKMLIHAAAFGCRAYVRFCPSLCAHNSNDISATRPLGSEVDDADKFLPPHANAQPIEIR